MTIGINSKQYREWEKGLKKKFLWSVLAGAVISQIICFFLGIHPTEGPSGKDMAWAGMSFLGTGFIGMLVNAIWIYFDGDNFDEWLEKNYPEEGKK